MKQKWRENSNSSDIRECYDQVHSCWTGLLLRRGDFAQVFAQGSRVSLIRFYFGLHWITSTILTMDLHQFHQLSGIATKWAIVYSSLLLKTYSRSANVSQVRLEIIVWTQIAQCTWSNCCYWCLLILQPNQSHVFTSTLRSVCFTLIKQSQGK